LIVNDAVFNADASPFMSQICSLIHKGKRSCDGLVCCADVSLCFS
jgi:hypothetical protein